MCLLCHKLITVLKGWLWLRLRWQIIIFSHNTLHELKRQWHVSSHNNKWLSTSEFKAWLSQLGDQWEDVSALNISYICKVWVTLECIKHTPLSGQADFDTQPKQAHYQKINCTEFACENMYMSKQQRQFACCLPVYKHTLLTGPLLIKTLWGNCTGKYCYHCSWSSCSPTSDWGEVSVLPKTAITLHFKLVCIFKKGQMSIMENSLLFHNIIKP